MSTVSSYRRADIANEGLIIARQDGVVYLESSFVESLGRAHSARGSHSQAIAALEEGLRLSRANQDWVSEVDLLGYYGDALYAAGEHAAARAAWTEFFDKIDAMGRAKVCRAGRTTTASTLPSKPSGAAASKRRPKPRRPALSRRPPPPAPGNHRACDDAVHQ
jgi:hypothetical protein